MLILQNLAKPLGALAIAAALLTSPATAQVDPGKLPAAKAAADKFVALAKGSEKTGNAPRLSDPAVKSLLDAVFDSGDVDAAQSIPFQQLTPLGQRMLTGVKVGLVYMLAGTGATDMSQLGNVADADIKVNLNVIKFDAEMGRFYDFQLRIQSAVVSSVLARLAAFKPGDLMTPTFVSGLADVRQGTQRTVAGVIETLAVNGITEQWRRERLPALTAIAPKLAKFLEPQQKDELHKLALACANVMDDAQVKEGLQQFAKAIAAG